ncbi:MAG: sugar transferase [Duncaniella sp.]|nr:sugar transferase [Duncaniella sp.]
MVLKQFFDRFASLIGLMILWPLMLVIAILIAVRMPGGPVLFRQQRVGRGGRLFTLVKFRTMLPSSPGSTVSVAGDPRITPLGATLRRLKLDELPELWNVLRGDMSLVGPRPDVPGYADRLTGDDRRVLSLRPGITGPATLKYRNEEQLLASQPDPQHYNDSVIFPDKVRINLDYLDNRSFSGDLRIILQTLLPSTSPTQPVQS